MNCFFFKLVAWKWGYRLRRKGASIPPEKSRRFQELYIRTDVEEIIKEYEAKQIKKIVYGLILLSCLTAFVCFVRPLEDVYLKVGGYLTRPEAGSREYPLYIDGLSKRYQIDIELKSRDYTAEEIDPIFEEVKISLTEKALGINESWNKVSYSLDFTVQPADERFLADWLPEDMNLISSLGEVYHENIPESGEETAVRLKLRYGSEERDYRIAVRVVPKVLGLQEEEEFLLESLILKELESQRYEKEVSLPKLVDGRNLSYKQPYRSDCPTMVILGVLIIFLAVMSSEEQLKVKVKKREAQMLLDYSGIVSKLTLLVDCGLTVKGAWERIVMEYNSKIQGNKVEKRYAYEEMQLIWNLQQNGTPELQTYRIFAKRCRVSSYIKLGSLLEQNLRRGTQRLKLILEEESEHAYGQRRLLVKKMGEEAGTKLLGPMMLMFVILLVLIFVPAILSFSTI